SSSTVTASYNNSSANATVSLSATTLVSSLTCPASLGPNASSSCTVILTKNAPAGNAIVTLTDTNAELKGPASGTVPAGQPSASFNVSTGAIAIDSSSTVTANYNNSSANATVNLVSVTLVSSLTCPSSLGPNASGSCTVTLTKNAPAGNAVVTLTNTN